MYRRLTITAGAAIVVAGTLLHFVYGWSGENRLVGLISPVNESVWEHTKLLVIPVTVVGVLEMVLLHDVRRIAWATLAEAILGAMAILAVFYTYTGALGVGPILWVDITSFVLVVAGGQWLHRRVLLSSASAVPPAAISLLALLMLLVLYAIWTVTPPDLPVFQAPGRSAELGEPLLQIVAVHHGSHLHVGVQLLEKRFREGRHVA